MIHYYNLFSPSSIFFSSFYLIVFFDTRVCRPHLLLVIVLSASSTFEIVWRNYKFTLLIHPTFTAVLLCQSSHQRYFTLWAWMQPDIFLQRSARNYKVKDKNLEPQYFELGPPRLSNDPLEETTSSCSLALFVIRFLSAQMLYLSVNFTFCIKGPLFLVL